MIERKINRETKNFLRGLLSFISFWMAFPDLYTLVLDLPTGIWVAEILMRGSATCRLKNHTFQPLIAMKLHRDIKTCQLDQFSEF